MVLCEYCHMTGFHPQTLQMSPQFTLIRNDLTSPVQVCKCAYSRLACLGLSLRDLSINKLILSGFVKILNRSVHAHSSVDEGCKHTSLNIFANFTEATWV